MKKLSKYITLVALAILASCAEEATYGIPNLNDDCTKLTANVTVEELATRATTINKVYNLEQDEIIEGYVVSSDEGGNIYKNISIVNIDNTKGYNVSIDESGLFSRFEPGRKVYVNLKGLVYNRATSYNNGINIGVTYIGDATRIGRIESYAINKHIQRACEKIDEELLVKKLTITEAKDDQYLNQLIEIDGVQFAETSLGHTYFDTDLKAFPSATAIDHEIKDLTENTLIVRVSEYANFASNPVANGSGKIRGILSKYNNGYQFMVRTINDIELNQPRFEYETPPPPVVNGTLAFIGADFENWQDFINSQGTGSAIYSTLISQKTGEGINNSAAMGIVGNTSSTNAPIFFIRPTATNLPANPTKLSFWVKGTSGKTISVNVFKTDGTAYIFNAGAVSNANKIINVSPSNSYTQTIDTNGEWILIELNIDGLADINFTNSSQNFFSFRIGSNTQYNLLIDNITIE
jgi:hypothetical protein